VDSNGAKTAANILAAIVTGVVVGFAAGADADNACGANESAVVLKLDTPPLEAIGASIVVIRADDASAAGGETMAAFGSASVAVSTAAILRAPKLGAVAARADERCDCGDDAFEDPFVGVAGWVVGVAGVSAFCSLPVSGVWIDPPELETITPSPRSSVFCDGDEGLCPTGAPSPLAASALGESLFDGGAAGAPDGSAGPATASDDGVPSSAHAAPGVVATAIPTPSARANAPTRPI
jgi:hypothetical protein